MAWIRLVDEDAAEGPLADIYARARESFTFVPDAVKVFSPRPAVAVAQEGLRRALLGRASSLGPRRADLVSAAVSQMNQCQYCSVAHLGNMIERGELGEDAAVAAIADWRTLDLAPEERVMLEFAEKLNATPEAIREADVDRLRAAGFDDENIYDIVLLTAYRNFMNRVLAGLGVTTERLRQRFGDRLVDAAARL
jgi:uncharacterized peroxidase-related enzyme